MPTDFFSDLVMDLYSIDEGQDIGLLALLHPNFEVRELVVSTLEMLWPDLTISSESLSRLQVIKSWYPADYQDQMTRWIKDQRRKEVVFHQYNPAQIVCIKASEVMAEVHKASSFTCDEPRASLMWIVIKTRIRH